MLLRYGSYTHSPGECALVISKQALFSPRGNRRLTRESWQIAGWLHAPNPAALTVAIAALRTAYAQNGQDAGLFLDDAVTPTDHVLLSANTLGGVRVAALHFPQGNGAEYSTFRSYRIQLEADFPEAEPLLWDHVETITFLGTGAARRLYLETLDGPPQLQFVSAQTTFRAIQQGRAVGGIAYPNLPAPLWPAAELADRRRVTFTAPHRTGPHLSHFAVEWHYTFESAGPLVGFPTTP